MPVEIRPVGAEDAEKFLRAMSGPFLFDLPTDDKELRQRLDRFSQVFEPDRARCAFDGSKMVGTLGVHSFSMAVPGGTVACAGTTMITVQVTHRRRGVLSRMMSAHLGDAIERDEPIAALWASDSAIYGRYGYGLATQEMEIEFPSQHATLHRSAAIPAPVEVLDPVEARERLPGIYAEVMKQRPGMFARSDVWWDRRLRDDPDSREGATAFRFLSVGEDRGYAIYRAKLNWEDGHGAGELRVRELMAADPASEVGLWSLLASTDLIGKVVAGHRPPDDVILHLFAGPRRVKAALTDALWIRVLDVPQALAARSYGIDGTVILEVIDPMGLSGGRFRLEHVAGVSRCDRTDREPDLTVGIEELGACYLGWSRFGAFGRTGRVQGTPEALRRADLMFGWDPAPWCPEIF